MEHGFVKCIAAGSSEPDQSRLLISRGERQLFSFPSDQRELRSAVLEILVAWQNVFGVLANEYFTPVSTHLVNLLSTPAEWRETGMFLLEKTKQVYDSCNGSQQFITEAIPSLFKAKLIRSPQDLREWTTAIFDRVNPMGSGEHLFLRIAERILDGRISSIEQILALKISDIRRK